MAATNEIWFIPNSERGLRELLERVLQRTSMRRLTNYARVIEYNESLRPLDLPSPPSVGLLFEDRLQIRGASPRLPVSPRLHSFQEHLQSSDRFPYLCQSTYPAVSKRADRDSGFGGSVATISKRWRKRLAPSCGQRPPLANPSSAIGISPAFSNSSKGTGWMPPPRFCALAPRY